MTLQKHHSLYDYALLLTVILYSASVNSFSPNNIGYHSPQVTHSDTTLPYRSGIINDSILQPLRFEKKLVKPEIRMNAAAVKFTEKFIKKNGKDLRGIQKRSDAFFDIIEPIFSKHDIPHQLKYLAIVESDLKAHARSKVGAVGLWQLMSGTARELGLKVAGKVDERKHQHKSTTAAAKYLKSLYKYYGDWLLVIASYNSGPGVVNAAIRKSGSRNFWKLQSHLPAETRGHVKRFIAIHYFFEEAGSETTLSKAENIAYARELQQYNCIVEELSKTADTAISVISIATTNR